MVQKAQYSLVPTRPSRTASDETYDLEFVDEGNKDDQCQKNAKSDAQPNNDVVNTAADTTKNTRRATGITQQDIQKGEELLRFLAPLAQVRAGITILVLLVAPLLLAAVAIRAIIQWTDNPLDKYDTWPAIEGLALPQRVTGEILAMSFFSEPKTTSLEECIRRCDQEGVTILMGLHYDRQQYEEHDLCLCYYTGDHRDFCVWENVATRSAFPVEKVEKGTVFYKKDQDQQAVDLPFCSEDTFLCNQDNGATCLLYLGPDRGEY
ncbi:expressed unknown protein [Seminavis robusta]|uniref:Uncharacterized protein n=1 Tax=Seminavis robusta TaxID=568900 RepID=A0A9N8D9P8_9STRA|nr:expressed unknown protein [Seminavis robusta]|eukprot:Sro43_g026260.1 n/a (264) ;mRNA; r:98286-99077